MGKAKHKKNQEETLETTSNTMLTVSSPLQIASKNSRFNKQFFIQQCKELTIIAAFVLVIIGHVIQGSMVIGESMRPTFNNGDGLGPDLVVVNKLAWYFQSWNYGDVIILYSPREPKKKLIKRLLARDGDMISIEGEKFCIGEGEVFVVGDNLDNSFDSRSFGPVSESLLQGKVWLQVWPLFPKFIPSEMVNKSLIHLEKALPNLTEEEILTRLLQAIAIYLKKPEDHSLAQQDLKKVLGEKEVSDFLRFLEKQFFLRAVENETQNIFKTEPSLKTNELSSSTLATLANSIYWKFSRKTDKEERKHHTR